MSSNIAYRLRTSPVSHFVKLYKRGLLNLSPGFQRKSVWGTRDREKLIRTIFDGFPVPSVFLYKREDSRGRIVYDVLDGKQRLEAIFAFCGLPGFARQRFAVKYHFPIDDVAFYWRWSGIKSCAHH